MGPPEENATGSSTQPLVWVNKTAASEVLSNSRSDQQHNFSIYSQAQRYNRYQRRSRQRWIPVARRILQPQSYRGSEKNSHLTTPRSKSSQINLDQHEIFSNITNEVEEIPRSPFTGGGSIDPFHTLPVKVDRQIHLLLQYAITNYCPNVEEATPEIHMLSNLRMQLAAHRILQYSMTNDIGLTSLLAHLAGRVEHIEEYEFKGGAAYFMQIALSTLRKCLENETGLPTWIHFYATFNLYIAESYRKDFESALTHLHAASHLGEQMGGFRALSWHVAETLIGGNLFHLYLAKKPDRPYELPTICDPGRAGEVLSTERYIFLIDPLLSSCGHGLLTRSFEEIISPDMKVIIEDVIEFAKIHHNAWIQKKIEPVVLQWLRVRSLALRHRLLSIKTLDDRLDAIRITIVIWLTSLIVHSGWKDDLERACSHLKEILLRIKDWHWDRYSEAQIWILMIGAISSQGNDFVERLRNFIRDEDQDKCRVHLQNISSRFFFLDSFQEASLKDLAFKLAFYEKIENNFDAETNYDVMRHEPTESNLVRSIGNTRSTYELCESGFW